MNIKKSIFYKGIIAAIVSSFLFSTLGLFSTIGQDAGLSYSIRLFARFSVSAFIMLIIILYKKKSLKIDKVVFIKLAIGSIFFFSFTSYLLFLSYDYIGIGLATVLDYTYPLIVLLLSIIIDKERVSKLQIGGTVLAFLGLIFLIGPSLQGNIRGILLALLSAVTFTLYIRMVAKDYIRNLDSHVLLFYLFLFSSIFWLVPAYSSYIKADGNIVFKGALISVFGLSILCTVLACTFFNIGIKNIGGRMTSVLSALDPIIAVSIGSLFLGEKLINTFKIGIALILIGTIVVSVFEEKKDMDSNILVIRDIRIKNNRVAFKQRFTHRA